MVDTQNTFAREALILQSGAQKATHAITGRKNRKFIFYFLFFNTAGPSQAQAVVVTLIT